MVEVGVSILIESTNLLIPKETHNNLPSGNESSLLRQGMKPSLHSPRTIE